MKKLLLFGLFLFIGGLVFAQTDYTFLIEKKSAGKEINISVFQALAAALVTDIDTLSIVTYSDNASYLFSPLSGNTPDIINIVTRRLSSETLSEMISLDGITSGLTLANEQANDWGCIDANQKLIIITSLLSSDKAEIHYT